MFSVSARFCEVKKNIQQHIYRMKQSSCYLIELNDRAYTMMVIVTRVMQMADPT